MSENDEEISEKLKNDKKFIRILNTFFNLGALTLFSKYVNSSNNVIIDRQGDCEREFERYWSIIEKIDFNEAELIR